MAEAGKCHLWLFMGNWFRSFPLNFWLMSLGSLFFFLSFNMILPELPDALRAAGGAAYIGYILPAFAFSALIARPLSGWVTDRLGRKSAMIGGAMFCVVAGIFYPLANTIFLFFLIRFVHGFSTGFSPTGFTAFTTDVVPEKRRAEALGWQGIFSNSGTALGYAIGSLLVLYMGEKSLYWGSSLLALLAIVIFMQLPETKPETTQQRSGSIFYWKSWPPALLMLLVCIPLGTLLTILPDYTLQKGYQNKGIFLTVYIGSSLLVRVFSGKLSDRMGRSLSIAIGSGFQIIALLMLLFDYGFFLSAILYGIGQGFNAPSLFAWAGDLSTKETRGRSLSMLFMALETGIIIGGWGAGHLFTHWQLGYNQIFGCCAIASILCCAFALGFAHKKSLQRQASS